MSVDPTGPLITFIAADPGVVAITTAIHGQRKAGEAPPFVVVRRRTSRRAFSGPGSDRMRVQSIDYVAFCYAAKRQDGYRRAYQLAGAVSGAVHEKGPLTLTSAATGKVGVYRMLEASMGEALTDPLSEEPFVPYFFTVTASADALP